MAKYGGVKSNEGFQNLEYLCSLDTMTLIYIRRFIQNASFHLLFHLGFVSTPVGYKSQKLELVNWIPLFVNFEVNCSSLIPVKCVSDCWGCAKVE